MCAALQGPQLTFADIFYFLRTAVFGTRSGVLICPSRGTLHRCNCGQLYSRLYLLWGETGAIAIALRLMNMRKKLASSGAE